MSRDGSLLDLLSRLLNCESGICSKPTCAARTKCENGTMTFDQIILVCLLIGLFGTFALDRFRIEVVAVAGLLGAFLTGLVPGEAIFSGFAHPAVITVAEILLLVGALQATHFIDRAAAGLVGRFRSHQSLLAALCVIGASISVFMNNIGALALMIPLATAVADRSGMSLKTLLMPVSFATLLGGTCSLIGTPANLIVSDALSNVQGGDGFAFFDFARVGLPVTLTGLIAIIFLAYPFLSKRTEKMDALNLDQPTIGKLILEATIPPSSLYAGQYLTQVEADLDGRIASIRRGMAFVFARREDIRIEPGDTILLEAHSKSLQKALQTSLILAKVPPSSGNEAQRSAVIVPESVVLGSRISTLEGFADVGVRVLAISSARKRLEGNFSDIQLAIGDVLHLAGPPDAVHTLIREYNLIGLAPQESSVSLKAGIPALLAFLGAVALAASGILRPELAFGAAIGGLLLAGKLDLVAAIRRLNWPIIIMLAAMIPIGAAVETTGLAELVSESFASLVPAAAPSLVVVAILLSAVLITPFINNASTAIVLTPIALELAARTGISAEVALLAVAIGVSIDFITPFGHHNNMIVMGIGGYRFRDFPIAGLPVLLCVLVAAALSLIALTT